MIINEVRPHDTIGVSNWRALQSAVNKKSAATLQHSDTTKTYSEQQTIKLYRWAKLHLDRNEQHAVFDKLASAEKIAQLLPNLQLREVAASKTKYSRNEIGYKNWNEIQRAVRHSSSNPSDSRHSARLTIDGREVVISKQSAERLFRWLKKNFKTKHERELYDFLVHQRLLGVLDDKPVISELAPSEPRDGDNRSVTHSDKVPKLCGLSFNAIHKLVESNNANNYSKFHNVISSQYSINDTLELYGIYLRQLDVHISGQTLLESARSNIERKLFKQFEERCAGSINNAHVGDSVSLLHLATLNVPGHKVVAKLNGFLSPKEIVKIVNNDSHVELEFADGSRYPDGDDVFQKIQTWNMTKLFSTSDDASKAYTTYALIGKQLSDKLDFTTSVNTDITEAKRKRKSRSRSTARTVYGGWWGGLGNDSGEDVTEGLEHSSQDLKDVAQWMHTTPDKLKIIVKQEPIEKFIKQIREMYGTYDEFPEDRERTESILELLKNGAQPMPVYVEEGDRDYFVMEGRHRMVAFWLAGMKTIPVAYVSVKEQDVTEGMGDYSDEEIQRYGSELIQRQRNLDLLASVFGQDQIHRVARALRAGNLKRNLSSAEGNAEYRSRYRRAVRILDSMTDESGNIMPHTDTTLYRRK